MHQRTKICDPVCAVIDYKKWWNVPYIVAHKMTLIFSIKDIRIRFSRYDDNKICILCKTKINSNPKKS
jgi:hypothetical protein